MSSSSFIGGVSSGEGRDHGGHYRLPASHPQKQLWFLTQLEPESSPAYNVVSAVRMIGKPDRLRLQQALNAVVARHESLRAGVALIDGEPQQVVLPQALVTLPVVDCEAASAEQRQAKVDRLLREESAMVFTPDQPPLVRPVLLRLAPDEHLLVVTVHHLVCDGWSMEVFFRDLAESYEKAGRGEPGELPEPPIQYADYVAWQEEQLAGGRLEELLRYWREKLEGAQPLELPTDRPRPAVRTMRGALHTAHLPADLVERLRALGQAHAGTLYAVLLTAFKVLLARWSGQQDISVGTPVAGRKHPDAEQVIGFFANTVVLRSEFADDPTFAEALETVRATCFEAFEHEDMPFDRLVEELRPPRDLSRTPLFQAMFLLQNTPGVMIDMPDLRLEPVKLDVAKARFELWLSAVPDAEGLRLSLEYNRDLFDPATVERWMDQYRALLEAAAADSGRPVSALVPVPEDERAVQTDDWAAGPHVEREVDRVTEWLTDSASETPGAAALSGPEGTLTYGELAERVEELASVLCSAGAGPGCDVAVELPHGRELAVARLAVLAAGATLGRAGAVPLSVVAAGAPDDGRTVARLGDVEVHERGDAAWSVAAELAGPRDSGTADQAAVTSSGALLGHRALANAAVAARERLGLTADDAVAVLPGVLGVPALVGQMLPLAAGARAVLPPSEELVDWEVLRADGVTTVLATSMVWRRLLDLVAPPPAGLRVLSTGAPAGAELAGRLGQEGAEVWTAYGPEEAGTWAMAGRAGGDGPALLGDPAANCTRYVLDSYLRPVPVGMVGELCLGGDGLASPGGDTSAQERFVADPFASRPGTLLRTGDLCRYTRDGGLEFAGRAGKRIKVASGWVDPEEVEAALTGSPKVAQAAVVAGDAGDDSGLVGWLVPASPPEGGVREGHAALVKDALAAAALVLPASLVPSVFGVLDELPVAADGTVDSRALRTMRRQAVFGEEDTTSPRDRTERRLTAVFQELLDVESVGVHANFFGLGGHSMLAARVMARVRDEFGTQVPVRDFFREPTVAGLAAAVTAEQADRHRRRSDSGATNGLSDDEVERLLGQLK
ncbi:condensation domain-containing protein [Actinopolyspora saharensis]|uniref:condensation domain-containing protein n=1 Tax=Actinopolyspora saharensis TaxID=995062 RepID=UPI003F6644D3